MSDLKNLLRIPPSSPRMSNKQVRDKFAHEIVSLVAQLNIAINGAGAMGLEVEITTSTNITHFIKVNVK